jgi:hypothetical protein
LVNEKEELYMQVERIAVGSNQDGRLEVFALDSGGGAFHIWQLGSGDAWGPWTPFGGSELKEIAVGVGNGRLALFAIGGNGSTYAVSQIVPNGNWTGWQGLGGTQIQQLAPGRLASGNLELFAIGGDGAVYKKGQTGNNGDWSDWTSFGVEHFRQIVAANNADGRLELFGLDGSGAVSHSWQTGAGDTWTGWIPLGGHDIRQIAVGPEEDGSLELLAIGGDQQIYFIRQLTPNGNWGAWSEGISELNTQWKAIAVCPDGFNFLHHFGIKAGGGIYEKVDLRSLTFWQPVSSEAHPYVEIAVAKDATGQIGRIQVFGLVDGGGVTRTPQSNDGRWDPTQLM